MTVRALLILAFLLAVVGCGGGGGNGSGSNPGSGPTNPPIPGPENDWIQILKPKLDDVHTLLLQMERQSNLRPDKYYLIRGWDLHQAVIAVGIPEASVDTRDGEEMLYYLLNLLGDTSGSWKQSIDTDFVVRKLIEHYKNGGT